MQRALPTLLLAFFYLTSLAQYQMESKELNFTTFSETKQAAATDINAPKDHPELGQLPFNAPCDNCYEDLDRRTADSRYFVEAGSDDSDFYLQQSYGPLHYKDKNGFWRTIDHRIKPQGNDVFAAPHQYFPVKIDVNEQVVRIENEGFQIEYNQNLELIHESVNGQSQSFGKADWSNYTSGDDGVKVIDAWNGIDMEMQVKNGAVKTNFIIKEQLDVAGGTLYIKDQWKAGELTASINSIENYDGEISLIGSGTEYFKIARCFAFDGNIFNDAEEVKYLSYDVFENGIYAIRIPVNWLNDESRDYPVTIDPLVEATNNLPQSTITGSGYDATCFNGYCTYDLSVQVPGGAQVTDVLWSFNYSAVGGCVRNEGAVDFNVGTCRSPSLPGYYWFCNSPSQGACNGNNISILSDIENCIPGTQCPGYDLDISMNFYRCNGTPGCNNNCIASNSAWSVTVRGNTLEVPNISADQTICEGESATISGSANYGMQPYTYTWTPGNLNGSTVSVSPNSSTTYTLTVTDACNESASASTNIDVIPNTNPGFTISPNPACVGETVTVTGQGNSPASSYDWELPGSNQGNVDDAVSGDIDYSAPGMFDITLNYENGNCIIPETQQVQITPANGNAAVSVNVSPSGSVCQGSQLTFTASPTNGGSQAVYDWKVNGNSVGSGVQYVSNSLVNGDEVRVEMTSSASCVSQPVVSSQPHIASFSPANTPEVSITATPNGPICAGNTINFSANPTYGGSNPTYQWLVNGNQVGSGSSYSSNSLNDSDVVTVEMTSNDDCISQSTVSSQPYNVVVSSSVSPSITIASNPAMPVCSGSSVTFNANISGGGNNPTIDWKLNGVTVASGNTYSPNNLNNGDFVMAVLSSSSSCASPPTAVSNPVSVNFTSGAPAEVSISATPNGSVCEGENITFTASSPNGGSNPVYEWKVNGNTVGNGGTFSSSNLNDGDEVTVELTSSDPCAQPNNATSTPYNVSIISTVTAAVSIQASPSGSICQGENVTFTANPFNGGNNPTYEWFVNGSSAGNSTTFSTSSLNNGEVVNVALTSNENCVSPATVYSNNFTAQVQTPVTPAVSISADLNSPICEGETVTFTPAPTNGGSSPTYQWMINGVNSGSGSSFSTSSLQNGDVVSVEMTSSEGCVTSATSISNDLPYTVNPSVVPTVNISASPAGAICDGTNVNFTASINNGGSNPQLDWQINGVSVSSGNTFSSALLNNGDQVTVVLTSNANCAVPASVTSNAIDMIVNANTAPAVTISSNPSGAVCEGENTTFTAQPVNGGANPDYQWLVNGSNAGIGNSFSTNNLNDGDEVEVILYADITCATPDTAVSPAYIADVVAPVTPNISITSTPNGAICEGTQVDFTAQTQNGGNNPTIEWQINGTANGNGSNFSSSQLNDGDVITAVLTSDAQCASPATVTSSPVNMTVLPAVTPHVSISATPNGAVCEGSNIDFTANASGGGSNPVFEWVINGGNVGNSGSFSSANLNNGDEVSVQLTSSENCASPATVTSDVFTVQIEPVVAPAVSIITTPGDSICEGTQVDFFANASNAGNNATYEWQVNGNAVGSGAEFSSSSLNDGDVVTVVVQSSSTCASPNNAVSQPVEMTVNPVLIPSVSFSANPNGTVCEGTAIDFTATSSNGGNAPVYEWTVNGTPVGNGSTFISSSLNNGDEVNVSMQSNAACAVPPVVNSNAWSASIEPISNPSASIQAQPNGTICEGENVNFMLTATNAGNNPSYEWQINGNTVSNSMFFSSNSLNDGDQVSLTVTSDATCATQPTANSNIIEMEVEPYVTPTVALVSDQSGEICPESEVTFTANATNGGTAPDFDWYLNGNPINGNANSVSLFNMQQDDEVYVVLNSSAQCASPAAATSNTIIADLTEPLKVTAFGDTAVCRFSPVEISAVATGGDGTYTYQWSNGQQGNEQIVNPGSATTYTITATDGCGSTATDEVSVELGNMPTANFSYSPDEPDFFNSEVNFNNTSSNASNYYWDFGDGNYSHETNPQHTFSEVGEYEILLISESAAGCVDSITYSIVVSEAFTYYIPDAFTPNNDGLNDEFKVEGEMSASYEMRVFDRWGKMVFETMNGQAWNGRHKNIGEMLPNGVYVYEIVLLDSEYVGKPVKGRITLLK